MKIACLKNQLQKGVNIVSKAVPARTTLPIQVCILIEGDESTGRITLTANDTELGIETVFDGDVIKGGRVAVNAKVFAEIVRSLPDSDVVIESVPDGKLSITCEKSRFVLSYIDGEEFAYLPEVERNNKISLSQFSLKEMINQTIFSVSEDDTNKIICSEYFEVRDNIFRIIALDGHRIAIRKMEIDGNIESASAIVSGKTVNEIARILIGDAEKTVDIYFTLNHIVFEFDDTVVVSRLIEGKYFGVDRMIPVSFDTKVLINKKILLSCIDRASLLISESDKKPLVLNITDNVVQAQIISQIGSMNDELDVNEKTGGDLMIGFNPKFLSDALRAIGDEDVSLYFTNPLSPCVIKNDGESYLYLILPVNINAV